MNSLTPEVLAELKRLRTAAAPMFEADHKIVLYTNGRRSDEEAHSALSELKSLLLEYSAALLDNSDKVDRLEEEVARWRIATQETLAALDGLDSTWRLNDQHPYGRGVSNWDGPSLLRAALARVP